MAPAIRAGPAIKPTGLVANAANAGPRNEPPVASAEIDAPARKPPALPRMLPAVLCPPRPPPRPTPIKGAAEARELPRPERENLLADGVLMPNLSRPESSVNPPLFELLL